LIAKPNPAAVVCESGNGMANVYLRGEDGWGDLPPVDARRSLARELLAVKGIDSVALSDGQAVELHTARGVGRVGFDGGLFQQGDPFAAEFAGASPREALARSVDEPWPDAAFALVSLVASPRAGDLLVSAKVGYDLRTAREWPEHHASHGALHRQHTLVPVLSSAPLPEPPLRTLDLFGHMLSLAGIALADYPESDAALIADGRWSPGVAA
jgi:hypothetical protein